MLSTPSAVASLDVEDLADWLEVKALLSADHNSSLQDLAAELRRSGSTEASTHSPGDLAGVVTDRGAEHSQAAAEDAMLEIEDRLTACAGGYPFDVEGQYVQSAGREGPGVYRFMLLLSMFGHGAVAGMKGAKLFEDLAAIALQSFLRSDPVTVERMTFGSPRQPPAPRSFKKALQTLCSAIGEGGAPNVGHPRFSDTKDGKVDVIAWTKWPDRRSGALIAFGQCATGDNWREKTTDLQPDDFVNSWLIGGFKTTPIKAFFVPARVGDKDWDQTVSRAGYLFDRCRIAAHSEGTPQELVEACETWSNAVLEALNQ